MVRSKVDDVLRSFLAMEEAATKDTDDYTVGAKFTSWPLFLESPFSQAGAPVGKLREKPIKDFPAFLPPLRFYSDEAGLNPGSATAAMVRTSTTGQLYFVTGSSFDSSSNNSSGSLVMTSRTKNLAFANLEEDVREPPEPDEAPSAVPVKRPLYPLPGGNGKQRGSLGGGRPKMLAQIGKKRSVQHFTMLSHRQMENYFGEGARSRFFDRFRAISSKRQQYTKEEGKHFALLQQHVAAHRSALHKEVHRVRGEEKGEKIAKSRSLLQLAKTRRMKKQGRLTSAVIDCGDSDDEEEGGEDDSMSSHSDDALMDKPLDFASFIEDNEDEEVMGPPSPRDIFLNCILETQHMPTAGELLRKSTSTSFNIAHKGVGDEYMLVLAKALVHMPGVRELNVADNRLTDASLTEVLRAVSGLKELTALNLGYNKLDDESSEMLRNYLASGHASVRKLVLARADIDDTECDAFVKAVACNESLTSVDLSNNLIGAMEVKNAVQPDFNTGGEAIAQLLASERCYLKTLDLSWNSIRSGSAASLGASLRYNATLVYLNLEYNGLGVEGGNALGDALFFNSSLRHLNVRNNSLHPYGAYCIAMAARATGALESLNMLENPVGYAGGRALMGIVLDFGQELEVKMGSCNFRAQDDKAWFNPETPSGPYMLDLGRAYDRAVMVDLLHMAATVDAIRINTVRHTIPGSNETREIRLELAMEKATSSKSSSYRVTLDAIHNAFQNTVGQRDRLRGRELSYALEALGLGPYPDVKYADLMAYYDVDGSGSIDLAEFTDMVWHEVKVKDETAPKRSYLREVGKTEVWEVPRSGVVQFKAEYHPVSNASGHYTVDAQVSNFMRICQEFEDANDAITLSKTYLTLHADQAQGIFEKINKQTGNKVDTVVSLLIQTQDAHSARQLQESNLRGKRIEKKNVQHEMGPLFGPIFGLPTGHYKLDLSKDMHRLCAKRLSQLSNDERIERARSRPDKLDTSQSGNGSNFRNLVLRAGKMPSSGVTEQILLDLPRSGVVEFDYVRNHRDTSKAVPMEDKRLLHFLKSINVLADWEMIDKSSVLREIDDVRPRSMVEAVRLSLELSRLYRDQLPADLKSVFATFPGEPVDVYLEPRDGALLPSQRRRASSVFGLTDAALFSSESHLLSSNSNRNLSGSYNNLNTSAKGREEPEDASDRRLVGSPKGREEKGGNKGELSRLANIASELSSSSSTNPFQGTASGSTSKRQSQLLSLKSIRDPATLMMRLRQDRHCLPEYVANLRYRAKRARINANLDHIVYSLKDLVASRWFTVRQARLIIMCFPESSRKLPVKGNKHGRLSTPSRLANNNSPPPDAPSASYGFLNSVRGFNAADPTPATAGTGSEPWWSTQPVDVDQSPRINMAVWLHQKVIDLHNYEKILDLFSPEERAHIIHRLGWLNVWSPLNTDGGYQLCLDRREEAVLSRLLVHLCAAEPGQNLLCQQYRFTRLMPPIPGWVLNATWFSEEGFGKKGLMAFFYYSGEGRGLRGCNPDMKLRLALHTLTQADAPRQLIAQHFPDWPPGLSQQELDVRLKSYLAESMAAEGITYRYEVGMKRDPPPLSPPPNPTAAVPIALAPALLPLELELDMEPLY